MNYLEIDKTIKIPIYKQIANCISNAIEDGRLKHNFKLPTEKEICTLLQISPTVAKKAYETLIQDHKIKRIKGKGTFVNTRNLFEMQMHEFYQIERYATLQKSKHTNHIILKEYVTNDIVVNRILHLNEGDGTYLFLRLIKVGDDPVLFQKIYLPEKYFPNVIELFDKNDSLYTLLENKYNMPIQNIHNTLSAFNAPSEIANLLDIEPDDAIYFVQSKYVIDGIGTAAYIWDYLPGEYSELEVSVYAE